MNSKVNISLNNKNVIVTGSAGFIGFHVAKRLLDDGINVFGIDNLNDYYSKELKLSRNKILEKQDNYDFFHIDLCDLKSLNKIFEDNEIDIICHLAAQAGVRYSIINPFQYQESNIEGFTNILEMARNNNVKNFVFASSSSVYGGNKKVPYSVDDRIEKPISFYAATKVANEAMAYSYHYLYDIPTIGLRFFTVYGPWGRPDMAYFKFTDNIVKGRSIDVYNKGDMRRDFTYIDDVVDGVVSSLKKELDFEIFNIGNNKPIKLMDFIKILEQKINKKAVKNMLPLQPGDMQETFADISKSQKILGFKPKTNIEEGIEQFIDWYKNYYNIKG